MTQAATRKPEIASLARTATAAQLRSGRSRLGCAAIAFEQPAQTLLAAHLDQRHGFIGNVAAQGQFVISWPRKFEEGSFRFCHRKGLETAKSLRDNAFGLEKKRALFRRGFLSGSFSQNSELGAAPPVNVQSRELTLSAFSFLVPFWQGVTARATSLAGRPVCRAKKPIPRPGTPSSKNSQNLYPAWPLQLTGPSGSGCRVEPRTLLRLVN